MKPNQVLSAVWGAKKKRLYILTACVCAVVVASVAGYFALTSTERRIEAALLANVPDVSFPEGDFTEIGIVEAGQTYIPDGRVPLGEPSDFDLLNDEWWKANVGHDPTTLRQENQFSKSITIKTDGYVLEGASFLNNSNAEQFLVVDNATDVSVRNALMEGTMRVYDNRERGSATIEHATFVTEKIPRFAVLGMGITARFNYISSLNDGIDPTGGLTVPNLIEYNWFQGPGYVVGDNHMDGIQLWQEGYTTIRRNRIGGFPNACILVKSDEKPRYGNEPVTDVLITENYFEDDGLTWYYLFVCQSKTNPDNYYQTRPQYVTITNNCFESKKFFPIYTGKEQSEAAIFVRTEAERDEGVKRQEANPDVLSYRQTLGWAKSAVDARTWIVWDGNYYAVDGSEVRPAGDKKDNGWYDLAGERKKFPVAEAAEVVSMPFTAEFMESTAGQSYIQWRLENLTEEPINYSVILPGETTGRQKRMTPGENLIPAMKFPGENNLVINWSTADGEAQTMTVPGVNFVVKDISAKYVTAPNDSYFDWEITNPNSFNMKGEWAFDNSSGSGNFYINKETTMAFRTPYGENSLILTWLDEYANKKSITVPVEGPRRPSAPALALTVAFVESTASTTHLNWIVTNPNSDPVTYYVKASGDANERKLTAQPGENRVVAVKVPGENTINIRWQSLSGNEESVNLFTLDNTVSPLSASFDKVINTYNDWIVENSNPFRVNYEWRVRETGDGAQRSAEPGSNNLRIPTPPVDGYTLVLSWKDEYGVSQEQEFHVQPQAQNVMQYEEPFGMPSEMPSNFQPETQPEERFGNQFESQPKAQPGPEPEYQPEPQPEYQPEPQPE